MSDLTENKKLLVVEIKRLYQEAYSDTMQLDDAARYSRHALAVSATNVIHSIEELLGMDRINPSDAANLFKAASNAIKSPEDDNTGPPLRHSARVIKECLTEAPSAQRWITGINFAEYTAQAVGGLSLMSYGMGILSGFFVLAMSPWGALALGVGSVIAGGYLASLAVEGVIDSVAYIHGSQIANLDEFVGLAAPKALSSKLESNKPQNASSSSDPSAYPGRFYSSPPPLDAQPLIAPSSTLACS